MRARIPVWLVALTLLLALLPAPLLEAKRPPQRTERVAPPPAPTHSAPGPRSARSRPPAGARRPQTGARKHPKTPTPTPTATAVPTTTPTPTPTPTVTPSPSGGISTVFLIVMENHDWSTIKGSSSAPYLNSLLTRPDAAYAGNYHNVPTGSSLHPSEPNYLWLEGATNVYPDHTFTTDDAPSASNSTSSVLHLVTLLQATGTPWKSYMEDISGSDCPISNSGNYTPRHNGILFFQDVVGNPPSSSTSSCQQHVRPYSELAGDLSNNRVSAYNVLIPNLCDDMHSNSCPGSSDVIKQGDDWLAANLPVILNSSVYQGGHALVAITWDEGGSGNNPIGLILLSPKTKGNGYTNSIAYSHASWVKTVEQIFGLSPLVGHAGDATTNDLGDLFGAGGGSGGGNGGGGNGGGTGGGGSAHRDHGHGRDGQTRAGHGHHRHHHRSHGRAGR
jgi:phosphatidylinositol-3-phosphatase